MRLLLLPFLLLLVGCSTLKDMYNYDYKKDANYWQTRASFYQTHYSECSDSDKALMLIDDIRAAGIEPKVETRSVQVISVYVFDIDGGQLWPVHKQEKHKK